MKWLLFAAMLAAVPALLGWLKQNPRHAPVVSGIIGALVFVYAPWQLKVTPLPWPVWPGYVRGIQITVLDVVALAVVLAGTRRPYNIPFQWLMLLYLAAVVIAATQSGVPVAATFYMWQLLRMYVVFRAVALVAQDERHWTAVMAGLIVGVAFQTLEAGWGRAHGMVQSGGTLGHQNLLGMLTNIVLMPSLAMAMAGIRVRWATLGIVASALALVFTASRGSISIGAVGVGLTIILSLIRRPSAWKWKMTGGAIVVLAIAAPLALASLSNRFDGSSVSFALDSDEVRVKMEHATEAMISDHPMGVGSNYFVVAANKGKYWSRSGIPVTKGNMAAHVHNSYLLVTAESGYIGLVALCLLLLAAMLYPLRTAFRYRSVPAGDVLLGLGVSILTVALHNRVEWGLVTDNVQYMLAIIFGLIAGVSRNVAMAQSIARNRRRRTATGTGSDQLALANAGRTPPYRTDGSS